MNNLPQTTKRRLQKIPQIKSVWEGDRRSVDGLRGTSDSKILQPEDCIIWVDGSEGVVRAMDITTRDVGPEAVVRTLLRAIENPHSPSQPARPQKIVVRNRELQFFLRGALQDLDIVIDYAPDLPLIDQLFRNFNAAEPNRPPALPPNYEPLLLEIAEQIETAAPWDLLTDHDIISVEFNRWDVGTIYICVMGMSGQEYGLILYRSLESLKHFRQAALSDQSNNQLEQAFLSQDCWFLNFESTEEVSLALDEDDQEVMHPLFGSIHPYEGMRPFLDEEESQVIYYALQAFLRFYERNQRVLSEEPIRKLHKSYRFPMALEPKKSQSITLKISTLPDLSSEFLEMLADSENEDNETDNRIQLSIRDDLIPDNAFLSLGMIPWEMIDKLQHNPKTYYQSLEITAKGEGMPVILVQTSRPKAKKMISTLKDAGNLQGICFNPGEDPWEELNYDLGLLQAGDGSLFIFGEFLTNDPEHEQARKKWDHRCQQTGGYCGLIVAMGVTGSSRGNPQLPDMMAVFEAKSLDADALAMGVLRLMPQFE
ncbi:MAG: hypothetical protein AAGF26_06250 [Cyanobacteria bacterium P01_G01_bin.49]